MNAFFGDLANVTEAEDLETAGVGEDWAFPLHKIVQIAVQLHHFLARAQPQVESVTEDNLRARGFNFFRRHPFYGAVGAHRHEGWRFYYATIEHQTAAARATISGIKFKFHFHSSVPEKQSDTLFWYRRVIPRHVHSKLADCT